MQISKIFIGLSIMVSFLFAGSDLKPGDQAPDFELKDAMGKVHKLSDYKGKIVTLYFYPKDDTPGCTAEACNLRDNYSTLTDRGIVILGVSYDDTASHKEFTEKYNLPFTLLSDTDQIVAEKYNAKRPIIGALVAKRITYLIGPDGKILHIFDDVDTSNHTSQILDVLDKAKS